MAITVETYEPVHENATSDSDEASADWTDDLEVICIDVGSLARSNFAWACRRPGADGEETHDAQSIDAVTDAVAHQLERQQPVALGLEAPLFLPVPEDAARLGKARANDRGMPAWSSTTGASVMATGFVQLAWILSALHQRCADATLHLSWGTFAESRRGLLIWEAFVSGAAKGTTHEDDARNGVTGFCAKLPHIDNAATNENDRQISLVALAAIWAGWTIPLKDLRTQCPLIRATPLSPERGPIR